MVKEWVRENFCIGFRTDKGLMLDLDNITLKKAKRIAEALLRKHKLEGYLLIRSSEKNYHLVFNRYLRWRTILKIVFSQVICIRWGVHQARKGYLTLRISRKNNKNKPKVIKKVGKIDKLISEYLRAHSCIKNL